MPEKNALKLQWPVSVIGIAGAIGCGIFTMSLPRADAWSPRTWQPSGVADMDGTYLSQSSTAVTLRKSGGGTVTIAKTMLGDEDLRYLINAASVKNPFRAWTRTYMDQNGVAHTETFSASLVNITGFTSPLSTQQVVVVREDSGQKKGYPITEFDPASVQYVASEAPNYPAPPAPNDGAQYAIKPDEYDPSNPSAAPEPFNYHATDHFVFYWGNTYGPGAQMWQDAAFREMNYAYFEKIWNFYKANNSSLPYYNTVPKYKTNVYITGTGLSKYPDGFAFGGKKVVISPAAMLEGSSVIPHEFGHTNQFYSGGYQGPLDNVGWLWECDANWDAVNFVTGLDLAIAVYAERANYELDSSRMNYGSWPFLQYFSEHPKFYASFPFDMWKEAARDADGNATETAFETMQRLGVKRGVFKGNGVAGFGDIIGEMAAHNADWDYVYGDGYSQGVVAVRTAGSPYRGRTYLHRVPDKPGWYRPLNSQSPKQYGINIIDLQPARGSASVAATLSGIVDPTIGSDWRAMLVVTDAHGNQRYSREWRSGTMRMVLRSGDNNLHLAVTGAPDIYTRQRFRPGYNVKRHFPYEVRFAGCMPITTPVGLRSHGGVAGAPAPNGGGFVAAGAHVDPTAYIGPYAQVLDMAQVLGNARIEDSAVISGSATVKGSAVVSGYAVVRGNAVVTGNARVRDYAVVQDHATISGDARVREFANVEGDGEIGGEAFAKGFGDIYTSSGAAVGGGAIMGQDSEIRLDGLHSPIDYGTLYGFMGVPQLTDPTQVVDNKFLNLHYDFAEPRGSVLMDTLTDNDAVLRGKPSYILDGGKRVLKLNGTNQYAVFEGELLDSAGATIDMRVKWTAASANQPLIAFRGEGGSLTFTPSNTHHRAELVFINGSTKQSVVCSQAIPSNAFERITMIIGSGKAKIYLDGKQIGGSQAITNSLEAIRPTAGYLGYSPASSTFFEGEFYDVGVYRFAYPDYSSLTPPYARP